MGQHFGYDIFGFPINHHGANRHLQDNILTVGTMLVTPTAGLAVLRLPARFVVVIG